MVRSTMHTKNTLVREVARLRRAREISGRLEYRRGLGDGVGVTLMAAALLWGVVEAGRDLGWWIAALEWWVAW